MPGLSKWGYKDIILQYCFFSPLAFILYNFTIDCRLIKVRNLLRSQNRRHFIYN